MESLSNLISNQRKIIPDIGRYGKMNFDELKRYDKEIGGNIFGNECCLYKGKSDLKFITCSFRGNKTSLIRLLYHNYIDDIHRGDKIIFTCENKERCCNLNHFQIKKK